MISNQLSCIKFKFENIHQGNDSLYKKKAKYFTLKIFNNNKNNDNKAKKKN